MDRITAMRQVGIFFAITLGLSFLVFWGPLALFQVPTISFVSSTKGPIWAIILFILGGFVPSLVGLFLTGVGEGWAGLRRMGRRVVQFNIGWRWYLAAIAVIAFVSLVQTVTGRLLGISFDPSLFVQQLSSLLPLVILGPLSEELGWRGYAQDRLQKVFGPVLAGAVLGMLWALWHLPLFFMPGTSQYETGASFLPFFLTLAGLSVVFAWLHTQTGGSIWTAIFLHWIYTYASQVIFTGMGQNQVFNWLACVPYLIVAVLIPLLWKTKAQAARIDLVQGLRSGEGTPH
jgi:uncharacterized protein